MSSAVCYNFVFPNKVVHNCKHTCKFSKFLGCIFKYCSVERNRVKSWQVTDDNTIVNFFISKFSHISIACKYWSTIEMELAVFLLAPLLQFQLVFDGGGSWRWVINKLLKCCVLNLLPPSRGLWWVILKQKLFSLLSECFCALFWSILMRQLIYLATIKITHNFFESPHFTSYLLPCLLSIWWSQYTSSSLPLNISHKNKITVILPYLLSQ